MFLIEFLGLTALYIVIAMAIMNRIAEKKRKNPAQNNPAQNPVKEPWNNNIPLYVGTGACVATFAIAIVWALVFGGGPAVLLPEKVSEGTLKLGKEVKDILHNLWDGTDAKKPLTGLPWATGTWFWFKASALYFFLTLVYIPFGLWDEALGAVKKISERIKERHDLAIAERRALHAARVAQIEVKNRTRKKGEPETALPLPPPAKLSFFEFAKKDVLMELIFMGARELFRRKP